MWPFLCFSAMLISTLYLKKKNKSKDQLQMRFYCTVFTTCVLCSFLFLFSLLLYAGGQAQHSISKSLLVSVDTENHV